MATKPPTTGPFGWATPFLGQGVLSVPSDVWDDDLFKIFDNIDNALNFQFGITADTAASGDPILKVVWSPPDLVGNTIPTFSHKLYDGGGIAPCGFAAAGGGVTSLNALTGGLSVVAGSGIGVTPLGTNITIGNTGVLSLNTLTGGLTIAAGASISVTPSGGNTLTIAYTGGGGGGAHTTLSDMPDTLGVNTDHDPRYGGAGWAGTAKLKNIIDAIIANSDAGSEAGIGSGTHFHAYYAP